MLSQRVNKISALTFPKIPGVMCARCPKISVPDVKHDLRRAQMVSQVITADHQVLNEDDESNLQHEHARMVQVFSCLIQSYPTRNRTRRKVCNHSSSHQHNQEYVTPVIRGVGACLRRLELESRYIHPHRSGTNGIAERAVRRVTEGTVSVLVQ